MPQKVLISPDKFKGTLTAAAAAAAMARGWRKSRPQDTLELIPMSDGGDGFGEVIGSAIGAKLQKVKTVDAAHRPCVGRWWWEANSRTAIIESAGIIGLAMLPPGKFHPFELDTYGLGTVMRAATAKGAKEILIGIGGSATNDGGFGLARALGWEFYDRAGAVITQWTALDTLARISRPRGKTSKVKIIVAVDVQNPLLGLRGATRIYGPQKGIRPADYSKAEKCLGQLARVARRELGEDFAWVPGAGAAGGLGFGLLAFLNARPEPGFELFARHAQLKKLMRRADLVVTGEGAIDRSTLMGKGTGQIARLSRESKVPCIGLAGMTTHEPALEKLFTQVHALTDLTSTTAAKSKSAFWLERLAAGVAAELPSDL